MAKRTYRSGKRSTPRRDSLRERKRAAAANARKKRRVLLEAKRQSALADLSAGKSISAAAKANGLNERQLRRYVSKKGALTKRNTLKRNISRRVTIYSDGVQRVINLGTYAQASLVGKYMSAVRRFLLTQDSSHLTPFDNTTVVDITGKRYPLETRPKLLYRLSHGGGPSFEQIYRIVI